MGQRRRARGGARFPRIAFFREGKASATARAAALTSPALLFPCRMGWRRRARSGDRLSKFSSSSSSFLFSAQNGAAPLHARRLSPCLLSVLFVQDGPRDAAPAAALASTHFFPRRMCKSRRARSGSHLSLAVFFDSGWASTAARAAALDCPALSFSTQDRPEPPRVRRLLPFPRCGFSAQIWPAPPRMRRRPRFPPCCFHAGWASAAARAAGLVCSAFFGCLFSVATQDGPEPPRARRLLSPVPRCVALCRLGQGRRARVAVLVLPVLCFYTQDWPAPPCSRARRRSPLPHFVFPHRMSQSRRARGGVRLSRALFSTQRAAALAFPALCFLHAGGARAAARSAARACPALMFFTQDGHTARARAAALASSTLFLF